MSRVAILSGGHPGTRSGLQVVALTHGLALKRRGWEVSYFFPDEADGTSEYDGMRLHAFKRYSITSPYQFTKFLLRARTCWKRDYPIEPDVIHGHDYLSFFAVSPMCPGRARRVFTVHDPFEYHQRMLGRLRRRVSMRAAVVHAIEHSVYRRADAIHVISEFTRQRLHPSVRQRAKLVSNWIDTDVFRLPADREALRASMGIAPGEFLVFTARALEPRMGLDRLIRSMPEVKRKVDNCRLVIAGAGLLFDALSKLATKTGESITLLGFVSNDDLVRWYQAADLVVIPSINGEGFGLPVLEAMACGTPVLGTPLCAIPELLKGVPHRILAGTDEHAIAVGISRFALREHPSIDPKIERQYVLDHYSEAELAGRITADYD